MLLAAGYEDGWTERIGDLAGRISLIFVRDFDPEIIIAATTGDRVVGKTESGLRRRIMPAC